MTKRTLRGTNLKKIRTSGFRKRMSSKTGRRIINARRKKGRTKLTVQFKNLIMIKLRLKKYGRKGQPCYRIVAVDSRIKRDGRPIEELGFYNPMIDETHLKFQRIKERLSQGAQPTETVRNIFVKAKIFEQM